MAICVDTLPLSHLYNYVVSYRYIQTDIHAYRFESEACLPTSQMFQGHVGYAIPTELFSPFVSGAVDVVRLLTTDRHSAVCMRGSSNTPALIGVYRTMPDTAPYCEVTAMCGFRYRGSTLSPVSSSRPSSEADCLLSLISLGFATGAWRESPKICVDSL